VRRQPSRCGDSTPPDPGPCDIKVRAMCRRDHWHRGRPRLSLSRLQAARTRLVFRLKRRPRPQREDLGHRGGHALDRAARPAAQDTWVVP
jgi:hypothetical protein